MDSRRLSEDGTDAASTSKFKSTRSVNMRVVPENGVNSELSLAPDTLFDTSPKWTLPKEGLAATAQPERIK